MAKHDPQEDLNAALKAQANGFSSAEESRANTRLIQQLQGRIADQATAAQLNAETAAETAATPIRTLQNVADRTEPPRPVIETQVAAEDRTENRPQGLGEKVDSINASIKKRKAILDAL